MAAMRDEEDIALSCKGYSEGKNEIFLRERLGVNITLNEQEKNMPLKDIVYKYRQRILENAQEERYFLQNYMEDREITENRKLLLFDFFAGGTVQFFLERLLGRPVLTLYYYRCRDERSIEEERTEAVICCSGEGSLYDCTLFTQKNYALMERILSAPHGSVIRFRDNGTVEYSEHEEFGVKEFAIIESAVMDYFTVHDYKRTASLKFADRIAECLEYRCITLNDNLKKYFVTYNEYQGKTYDVFKDKLY